MTVSNTTVKQRFTGNGATVTFAIPCDFADNDEIVVYLRDTGVTPATETLQTEGVHYSITGGDPGTSVVMVTAPAADEVLLIIRNVVSEQETDYTSNGSFDAEAHEDALDHIIRAIQECDEKLTRVPLLPITTSFTSLPLPEPVASQILAWNSAATALENIATTDLDVNVIGSQTANTVYAGPISGGAAVPAFRALVSDDVPSLAFTKITGTATPDQTSPVSSTIAASAIDWDLGNLHSKTLAANTTFTFSNAADGHTIVVVLLNTASNYTVTWPAGIKWVNATAPTQTVGAKYDIYTFVQISSTIFGNAVQNLS